MKSNFKCDHSTGVECGVSTKTNKTIGQLTSNPPEATRSANTSATGKTAPITTNSKAYKADNRLNKLSLQISKLQNKIIVAHSGGECLTTDVTTPHSTTLFADFRPDGFRIYQTSFMIHGNIPYS